VVSITTTLAFAAETVEVPQEPVVVNVKVVKPKAKRVFVKKFTPWARPTPSQVGDIIEHESAKWGASASKLHRMVRCESTYNWAAGNGQYRGLGQFAYSTFTRGLSTMPRLVVKKSRRWVKRKGTRVTYYSNGVKKKEPTKKRKVLRVRVKRGFIPNSPPHTHGFAQIRIMAQAIVGKSAVGLSEWECQ